MTFVNQRDATPRPPKTCLQLFPVLCVSIATQHMTNRKIPMTNGKMRIPWAWLSSVSRIWHAHLAPKRCVALIPPWAKRKTFLREVGSLPHLRSFATSLRSNPSSAILSSHPQHSSSAPFSWSSFFCRSGQLLEAISSMCCAYPLLHLREKEDFKNLEQAIPMTPWLWPNCRKQNFPGKYPCSLEHKMPSGTTICTCLEQQSSTSRHSKPWKWTEPGALHALIIWASIRFCITHHDSPSPHSVLCRRSRRHRQGHTERTKHSRCHFKYNPKQQLGCIISEQIHSTKIATKKQSPLRCLDVLGTILAPIASGSASANCRIWENFRYFQWGEFDSKFKVAGIARRSQLTLSFRETIIQDLRRVNSRIAQPASQQFARSKFLLHDATCDF